MWWFTVLMAGFLLRHCARVVLDRFFTFRVGIRDHHRLVGDGPYLLLKHPGYTGGLLSQLGWTMLLADTLPLSALPLATLLVFLCVRIPVEERTLRQAFGAAWEDYASTRWRLVPFIF